MLWIGAQRTLLNELEAISDAALIGHKKEAPLLGSVSLACSGFLSGDFGSELNAVAYDAMLVGNLMANIGSRSCLAGVCCVWASIL